MTTQPKSSALFCAHFVRIVQKHKRLSRLGFTLGCLFLLGGCGPATINMDQVSLTQVEPKDWTEYRAALDCDGRPLTDVEMEALFSTGVIDRNLGIAEMAEVQKHFKYFVHTARPTMERFLQRKDSYYEHARKVFRERGLPEELACLAFVESGYNPVAVSRSGAVGLWQFMPATGREYGLTQDWWMDQRRDPYLATYAAADFLGGLYKKFGDWHLAIAAYNAGGGKIDRALQGTNAGSFFELLDCNSQLDQKTQLREETQNYVPRFLAMIKIIRNADKLGFTAAAPKSETVCVPHVTKFMAGPGTDLLALARSVDMSWDEFTAYNPAFRRYITPSTKTVPIYVPEHKADRAATALRNLPAGAGWTTFTVGKGDTLSKISSRTGVPVAVLRECNRVQEPLKKGSVLRLPITEGKKPGAPFTQVAEAPAQKKTAVQTPAPKSSPKISPKENQVAQAASKPASSKNLSAELPKDSRPAPTSQASAQNSTKASKSSQSSQSSVHSVRSGETLAVLSRLYNVNFNDMRAANAHLPNLDNLKVGQQVVIPAGAKVTAVASASASAQPAAKPAAQQKQKAPAKTSSHTSQARLVADNSYQVQSGDTVWAIARKFNMDPTELLRINNMTRETSLKPGDAVRLPTI